MDTAIAFARTVTGESKTFYNPSQFGLQGETDRISISEGRYRPKTDIFEYYWAHEFRDNKFSTINNWFFRLFLGCSRKIRDSGARSSLEGIAFIELKEWLVVLGGSVYLLGALCICIALVLASNSLSTFVCVSIALFLVYKLVLSNLLLGYIADAAKYLSNHPDNIASRMKVRSGAIKLLRELHESEDYDRILVVGHSLGSVIGLDAITQYWYETLRANSDCDCSQLKSTHREMMASLGSSSDVSKEISTYQRLQRHMRRKLSEGITWKISDFVTIGSPLSFANYLVAMDDEDFYRKTHDTHQILVSPPAGDSRAQFFLKRIQINGRPRDVLRPAARTMFLFTRWTNLYGSKDLIGGPVAALFGRGVLDIKVESSGYFSAHVEYFSGQSERISNQLISALKLDTGREVD